MKQVPQAKSVGDMLRAEMDVALELYRLQTKSTGVNRYVIKVNSHIEKEQAPDEFLWECNELVDSLATAARLHYTADELQKRETFPFSGTVASCKIQRRVENNGLFQVLNDTINGYQLKYFLLQKYGWNNRLFDNIAWTAHSNELKQSGKGMGVTLIKYVHGWLSTQRRSYREGRARSSLCPLCGKEDARDHIFNCTHDQLRTIRQGEWNTLRTDIRNITDAGCREVFILGLGTVLGLECPTNADRQDWPSELTAAYEAQVDIGWDQVLYGRVSTNWENLAQSSARDPNICHQYRWTRKVIRKCWQFGLNLWKARNAIVHGTEGTVSKVEQDRTREIIRAMYRELEPRIQHGREEVFPLTEDDMLRQTYQTQIAWLSQLRYLYADTYGDIAEEAVGKLHSDLELELQRLRITGTAVDYT